MAVNRACYCTRQDVMSAPDIAFTADMIRHVDSAIESAADDVDRLTKRRFWNAIETNKWDWPNHQRAYPWRIWLDAKELADVTALVPTVTTGGNVIPSANLLWGPWNYAPPYYFVEIDRSTSSSFGQGVTPQQDVKIHGNYGYWTLTKPGGSLAVSLSDTTGTAVQVSDGSAVGVGDVIQIGTESVLLRDVAMASTGLSNSSGCTTDVPNDNVMVFGSAPSISAGEIIALDSEWMLATSVTGNNVTVERAVAGTVIATHSAGTVYALRQFAVARAFGGTTAATHTQSTAVTASLIPAEVRELSIAESLNYVFQKTSGYARTVGENQTIVPGGSLPDLRARVRESYARKARTRVV